MPPAIASPSPVRPVAAPTRQALPEKTANQPQRVIFLNGQSSATVAGSGNAAVYLAGAASDWIADGSGTYTNRFNSAVRVTLRNVEMVRFYATGTTLPAPAQLNVSA